MKLLTLITFATAALADNIAQCIHQTGGKHTVKAIQEFCAKPDIVVPSTYAQTGHSVGGHTVLISGNCNPPQWVPQYWCEQQFYDMCANAQLAGPSANARYGNDQCQWFAIGG